MRLHLSPLNVFTDVGWLAGWLTWRDAPTSIKIKVNKKCNIKFVISVDFIHEVELDVAPIDIGGVVFGRPNMYMRMKYSCEETTSTN
jgi:hypothetical protein